MIKHLTFVRLCALFALAAGLLALSIPVHTHADSAQSTAAVSFTLPKKSEAVTKVPSIAFDSAEVSGQATDVAATSIDPAIVVANAGAASGWTMTVAATDLTSADQQHRIKSAQLTFAQSAQGNGDTTVTTGGDAQAVVEVTQPNQVVTARYAPEDIRLHIPAGNVAADYSGKLQWTLTDTMQ